jgi:SAM-dependent methyltransferase
MQLCLAAPDEATAQHLLAYALAGQDCRSLQQMAALWRDTPGVFALVNAVAGQDAHRAATAIPDSAYWGRVFDGAAAISPEAGVALYSLGRPDLLERVTGEVVDWLDAAGLLGCDHRVLEIGCGIGRILAALAPRVRSAVGLDVSAAMVAEARRRLVGHANLQFAQGDARDLGSLGEAAFDLVLAVDVFPYLVESGGGAAADTVAAVHRHLRPAGRLVVMNYSYRGDEDADAAELAASAAVNGFAVRRCGGRPFRLWDGTVYELERL